MEINIVSFQALDLFISRLMATNHIVLYAVQNYKDLILLFGNYEAQNVIMYASVNLQIGKVTYRVLPSFCT
jgi:hypothetical protein